jgi:hypothetical protein
MMWFTERSIMSFAFSTVFSSVQITAALNPTKVQLLVAELKLPSNSLSTGDVR